MLRETNINWKYVFNQIGTEGILKLLEEKDNRKGKSIEVLAYASPNGDFKTFRMDTDFIIGTSSKGTGSVMDKLMEIKGQKANYGSLSLEEKLKLWKSEDNYFHEFSKWFINKESNIK